MWHQHAMIELIGSTLRCIVRKGQHVSNSARRQKVSIEIEVNLESRPLLAVTATPNTTNTHISISPSKQHSQKQNLRGAPAHPTRWKHIQSEPSSRGTLAASPSPRKVFFEASSSSQRPLGGGHNVNLHKTSRCWPVSGCVHYFQREKKKFPPPPPSPPDLMKNKTLQGWVCAGCGHVRAPAPNAYHGGSHKNRSK